MAMQVFQKSKLDTFKIQNIINLVDPSITAKIKMNIYQYTVIAHLIALYKQGVEPPSWLPDPLKKYLEQAIGTILVHYSQT